jgi:two-component system CheB/CheR fusion protein
MKNQKTKSERSHPQPLIVGIGASAGGVEALMTFFEQVPSDSGMAFIVILHLSPNYDSQLAHILQTVTQIPVTQVIDKQPVLPNQVYVIPPNQHLQMVDGHLAVFPNQGVEERRAPVDIFFRTLAETHRTRAVGVILSGSGANGSMGLKRIKENGGAVFVQNPYEAPFNEMPRNAIASELVDDILSVAQIPARLIAYSQNLATIDIPEEAVQRPQDQQQALREVFTQLRLRTGHDFSNYKRPTLLRRLERRISVRNLPDLPTYAQFLQEHPEETQALLKDLLISVTNFFRDSAVFAVLE